MQKNLVRESEKKKRPKQSLREKSFNDFRYLKVKTVEIFEKVTRTTRTTGLC